MNPELPPDAHLPEATTATSPTPIINYQAPTVPIEQPIKHQKTAKLILIGTLVLIIGGVIGFGIGYYIHQNEPKQAVTVAAPATKAKTTPIAATSNDPAAGYRGGTNGVKLLEPIDTAVTQTLDLLALNYKQNQAYSSSSTAPMLQNWQRYGYNGKEAGPSLKCPADNGYFSYTGYTNPKTGLVDNFELYYCNGSTLVKKTQIDI